MCNCKKHNKQPKHPKCPKPCGPKPCEQFYGPISPFVPGYYSGSGTYGKVELGCGYYTGGSSSYNPYGQQTTTGIAAWTSTGANIGLYRSADGFV